MSMRKVCHGGDLHYPAKLVTVDWSAEFAGEGIEDVWQCDEFQQQIADFAPGTGLWSWSLPVEDAKLRFVVLASEAEA